VKSKAKGPILNRRNFLRGAGTVAVGLPFLEGLPERSAWAADAVPVFTLFVVAQNGVVKKNFFPAAVGAITQASLMGATDRATSVLAPHAANMLFISGINYTKTGPQSCGHAEGNVQTLTGLAPGSTGNAAYGAGPSADTSIAKIVNAGGADPFALYSGTKGFIAERISFKAAGAGQVRATRSIRRSLVWPTPGEPLEPVAPLGERPSIRWLQNWSRRARASTIWCAPS
jgi:hypothetical protein